jgi:hypothetical protein
LGLEPLVWDYFTEGINDSVAFAPVRVKSLATFADAVVFEEDEAQVDGGVVAQYTEVFGSVNTRKSALGLHHQIVLECIVGSVSVGGDGLAAVLADCLEVLELGDFVTVFNITAVEILTYTGFIS